MDVKTAFLNGILHEEVYVSQPDRFVDQDNLNHVYKLKKALCGLKQAHRAWYDLLSKFLLSQEFSKGTVDPTLLVSWSAKRQKSTAMSSTEVEYIALSGCCAQVLWMRSQLTDYGLGFNKIPMYCDKKAPLPYAATMFNINSRSKHIDINFHFIKEQVKNGVVGLYFVNMEYQLVDIFTKAIGRERIEFLINKLGMRSFTPKTLKQLADEAEE
ncbi:retrovirus-related pol polyprotein from transposon TNT 1-94 [Tanacetum coccineum]